jgi:GntR family transcriptional regulator
MGHLDRHLQRGPLPLWFQIKEQLRHAIDLGEWAPGEQLPTENELIEFFGVSRITIRTAFERLGDQGLVERIPGRGTFVAQRSFERPVTRLAGFHEDMASRGFVPSTQILSAQIVPGPGDAASALGAEGEDLVEIRRLLLADRAPMAVQHGYLPTWVMGNQAFSASDLLNKSLYRIMAERTASYPASAEETIEAVPADRARAGLLEVSEGSPLLLATRLSLDRSHRPVEYVRLWYRADRYRFRVELQRP